MAAHKRNMVITTCFIVSDSISACKVTKNRAQNKETGFFFCRDGVSSPSLMAKLRKFKQNAKENLVFCSLIRNFAFQ
jgi:hypothetical protein